MDETLRLIAKQHKEWIKIINSFGEYDYAEDLVQEMYILVWKYGSKEKIIRGGKVSRGYIFITLRNLYYQYFNSKKKIEKISIDNQETTLQIPYNSQMDEEVAFYKICTMIDEEVNTWHWYDSKLWKLYSQTDMSIRKIASETNISWVSIWNSLKNYKLKIKDKFQEDWDDLKNEDYERI